MPAYLAPKIITQLKCNLNKTQSITNKKYEIIKNRIKINLNCQVLLTIKNWIMEKCSIASCTSHPRQNCNSYRMVFFREPLKPKMKAREGKNRPHNNKKNSIIFFQNEVWLADTYRGHANSHVGWSDSHIARTWTHYFYSRVIISDFRNQFTLKIGAALTSI